MFMVEWLADACSKFKLEEQAIFSGVHLLDRYLSVCASTLDLNLARKISLFCLFLVVQMYHRQDPNDTDRIIEESKTNYNLINQQNPDWFVGLKPETNWRIFKEIKKSMQDYMNLITITKEDFNDKEGVFKKGHQTARCVDHILIESCVSKKENCSNQVTWIPQFYLPSNPENLNFKKKKQIFANGRKHDRKVFVRNQNFTQMSMRRFIKSFIEFLFQEGNQIADTEYLNRPLTIPELRNFGDKRVSDVDLANFVDDGIRLLRYKSIFLHHIL